MIPRSPAPSSPGSSARRGTPTGGRVAAAGQESPNTAAGDDPRTLVAGEGACHRTDRVAAPGLALGLIENTVVACPIHPGQGGTGIAPGRPFVLHCINVHAGV
ncbi:hypothetical protein ACFC96_24070 [Streptomyces sp. NPDC055955]|uniref:hypothetical protein n=1 Tax=Streptomyces sp. NPDC055955 TaxID=3345665 RepID=UPI0035E0B752